MTMLARLARHLRYAQPVDDITLIQPKRRRAHLLPFPSPPKYIGTLAPGVAHVPHQGEKPAPVICPEADDIFEADDLRYDDGTTLEERLEERGPVAPKRAERFGQPFTAIRVEPTPTVLKRTMRALAKAVRRG